MQTALLPQVMVPLSSQKRPRTLSPEQVLELRSAHENGTSVRALALRYGIGKSMAHDVATGRLYSDVAAQPKIEWFDPTVRSRGVHNDDELRIMVAMLRQHPGKWVLVKKTLSKPSGEPYCRWGLDTSGIQLGDSTAGWGLYVRWPLPEAPVVAG